MSGPYWEAQWNPVMGCTHAGSPGCDHCWARQMHERFHEEPFSDVRAMPDRLSKPLHWRKPRVIFVCNTSDLFHPSVPFEFIAAVYGVMAACPQHMFLVLTKRPERRRQFVVWLGSWDRVQWCKFNASHRGVDVGFSKQNESWPILNVWEGVTVENQLRTDERIPLLQKTPAAHRWVSAEPLLGGIDLDGAHTSLGFEGIDQVVVGGESGPRQCNVEWIRSIRDQCEDAGTKCFIKQLGSHVIDEGARGLAHAVCKLRDRSGSDPSEWPEDLRVRELAWGKQ